MYREFRRRYSLQWDISQLLVGKFEIGLVVIDISTDRVWPSGSYNQELVISSKGNHSEKTEQVIS